MNQIRIGWGTADLTPTDTINITGQFHVRLSEGVLDPITTTALALDSGDGNHVILVSCDLVGIADGVRRGVRQHVAEALPELAGTDIILSGTHTHAGPETRTPRDDERGLSSKGAGIDLPAIDTADYVDFIVPRIASAIITAWQSRAPGAIGYGLGQAVVGRNRRSCYEGNISRMYGNTNSPDFTHIEGYEDHDVNILATWDTNDNLTGLLVNVPCPSQVTEQIYQLSADYWCETRQELRARLGDDLYILPQCSAAGDLSPHIQYNKQAEARMRQLADRTERQEIAQRLANAVTTVLPIIARDKQQILPLSHKVEEVQISRRCLSQEDVDEALVEAAKYRQTYDQLRADIDAHPEKRQEPRWYVEITKAWRRMNWYLGVEKRYQQEQECAYLTMELHALRLGQMALVTNPTEYYLDFGIVIKARSVATQTFITQLAGPGTYVPSPRATAGGSYGAVPASTPIGDAGGKEMAEWSLKTINTLFTQS